MSQREASGPKNRRNDEENIGEEAAGTKQEVVHGGERSLPPEACRHHEDGNKQQSIAVYDTLKQPEALEEERYECPVDGCGRWFSSLDLLLSHWPVHEDQMTVDPGGPSSTGDADDDKSFQDLIQLAGKAFPTAELEGRGVANEASCSQAADSTAGPSGGSSFGRSAKRKPQTYLSPKAESQEEALREAGASEVVRQVANLGPRKFSIPPFHPRLDLTRQKLLLNSTIPTTAGQAIPGDRSPVAPDSTPTSSEPPKAAPVHAASLSVDASTPLVGGDAFPLPEALRLRALRESMWAPVAAPRHLWWGSQLRRPIGLQDAAQAEYGSAANIAGPSKVSGPVWRGGGCRRKSSEDRLSDQELKRFMESAELQQYITRLEEEWVTMSELPHLTEEELAEFGIPPQACIKLKTALKHYTPPSPPPDNSKATNTPPAVPSSPPEAPPWPPRSPLAPAPCAPPEPPDSCPIPPIPASPPPPVPCSPSAKPLPNTPEAMPAQSPQAGVQKPSPHLFIDLNRPNCEAAEFGSP